LLALCAPATAEEAPPLPDRNPMRVPEPKVEKPPLPGELPTVPWTTDEIAAAKASCESELKGVALEYEALEPIKQGLCGAPAPILVKSIGSDPKVIIVPAATVRCSVARALAAWLEKSVQPEAKARFGSPVIGLHNAASYSCRNRNGAAVGPISEHALANAFDVSEFVFASGLRITVTEAWPKMVVPPPPAPSQPAKGEATETAAAASTPKPAEQSEVTKAKAPAAKALPAPPPVAEEPKPDPTSSFVHKVHNDACNTFGTVLGPDADAAHKTHFHLDMKERHRSGFCQ
jgi:hypothetical protein